MTTGKTTALTRRTLLYKLRIRKITGFTLPSLISSLGLPWWLRQKRICLQCRRPGFYPWVGKIPWRREWQLIPVFLPGESHSQRSLAGYSPWGHKESDKIEQPNTAHTAWLILTSAPLTMTFSSLRVFNKCRISNVDGIWLNFDIS